MLSSAVEIYANHPVLIIGATVIPEVDWSDGPAGADSHHVAVITCGQVAHTRVCIWSHAMPMVGEVVFDGELDLPDHTICVGDIERLGRWTQRINETGPQRVVVMVDDPGSASRVHVGLNLGTAPRKESVPSTNRPALFSVLVADGYALSGPNEFGIIRDGHDSPRDRLWAMATLLSSRVPEKPWLEGYEIRLVAEWLRWVGLDLRWGTAEAAAAEFSRMVLAARDTAPDQQTSAHESVEQIVNTILNRVQ